MKEQLEKVLPPSAIRQIVIFAVVKLLIHTYFNTGYGFHRDELQTLDDARHLAWGYVVYPPLTPFLGRVALTIFGESLAGFRFFAAVAQCIAMLLTASMARHMGGGRAAQWIAALAVAASGVSLAASSLMQYVAFDYLFWVLLAWSVVRLISSGDSRWWLAIGAAVGLGLLTKYTILFIAIGLFVGTLVTPLRAEFKSKWLWIGVALAFVMFLPHLLWQWRHDFITYEFLQSIHARDVAIGRTDNFLRNQLFVPVNPFTVPLWIAGVVALLISPPLKRFRPLLWMALVPMVLFVIARGRDYYAAPLYPMLFAVGATWFSDKLRERPRAFSWTVAAIVAVLVITGVLIASLVLPVHAPGTPGFERAMKRSGDLREEIGWPELVEEVARVWNSLPAEERARTAILAANYGEAGAINLYGPRYGLPPAISGVNSFWLRGYGTQPPIAVITVGRTRERLEQRFESVELAGKIPNPYNVANEESERPEIYICRGLRMSWDEYWKLIRSFG